MGSSGKFQLEYLEFCREKWTLSFALFNPFFFKTKASDNSFQEVDCYCFLYCNNILASNCIDLGLLKIHH